MKTGLARGNILEDNFEIIDVYRRCENFGYCHPCDVKIKTNRFQEPGHTSVAINLGGETSDG